MHKICAFTGHRPVHPTYDGWSERDPALEATIRQALSEGFTLFRSGGAMGFDLFAADSTLRLKAEHPAIRLHFILPCETQANRWPEGWRERYFATLALADEVTYVQARYTPDCMLRRNRALIDGAQLVIARYDGRETGGTAYTVRFASERGVRVCRV